MIPNEAIDPVLLSDSASHRPRLRSPKREHAFQYLAPDRNFNILRLAVARDVAALDETPVVVGPVGHTVAGAGPSTPLAAA